MEMAKYCTRCNKCILTAWRTLDEKKYYHPHCFTCAVCNVILECVQECGVPNLKEIYCKKCYKECLRGEKLARWYEKPKSLNNGQGQGEELMQLETHSTDENNNFEQTSTEISPLTISPNPDPDTFNQSTRLREQEQQNFGLTFTSQFARLPQNHPEQYLSDHFQNENLIAAHLPVYNNNIPMGNQFTFALPPPETFMAHKASISKPPAPPPPQRQPINKKAVTEVAQERSNIAPTTSKFEFNRVKSTHRLERTRSRIPRPTSATQCTMGVKKSISAFRDSIPTPNTARGGKPKARTKPSLNQISPLAFSKTPTTNSRSRPSPVPQKMSRSISMFHPPPRTAKANSTGPTTSNGKAQGFKQGKSFTRPRSAVIEQHYTSPRIPQTFSNSRRQCAASFSNHNHQNNNSSSKISQHESTKAGRRVSELYHQDQAYFKQTKMGVPTPQAILSVVRKERSDLTKSFIPTIANNSGNATANKTKEDDNGNPIKRGSKTGILPKRNFNITFDCPICIGSLVPGVSCEGQCCNGSSKGTKGNVVTICGHLFHRECMENWLKLKGNKRCPICSSLCLPETLQPVYLECNVSAEVSSSKQIHQKESTNFIQANKNLAGSRTVDSAYLSLKYEHDQLRRKYNTMLQEKNNYSLNATIANSLQNAYDMECRNRLQLQWENKKLQQQIQELLQRNGEQEQ